MTKKEITERLESFSLTPSRVLVNALATPGIHTFAPVKGLGSWPLRVFTAFDFESADLRFPFWSMLRDRLQEANGAYRGQRFNFEIMPFRTTETFVKLDDHRYHTIAQPHDGRFIVSGNDGFWSHDFADALKHYGCSGDARLGFVDPVTFELGFEADPEDFAILRLAPEFTHESMKEASKAYRDDSFADTMAKAEAIIEGMKLNPKHGRGSFDGSPQP